MSDGRAPAQRHLSFPAFLLGNLLGIVIVSLVWHIVGWSWGRILLSFPASEAIAMLLTCLWRWRSVRRFFQRLPRAIAIANAEWKRQARYAFIAKERKRRRKAALKERVGYQPIGHIKPGVKPPNVVPATMRGYQPIGTVDLTNVTPPQRPSAIAPQSQVLPKTFEAYLEEHPEVDRQKIEEDVARARRLWEGIFGQAADLPNFPQGVTILGKPDLLPVNPPYNPRINTIIGASPPPRCKPGEHKWMDALAFGTGRSYRVCSRCGVQRGKPKKGRAND